MYRGGLSESWSHDFQLTFLPKHQSRGTCRPTLRHKTLSCAHGVGGCFLEEGSVPASLLTKMKLCDCNAVSSLSVCPKPVWSNSLSSGKAGLWCRVTALCCLQSLWVSKHLLPPFLLFASFCTAHLRGVLNSQFSLVGALAVLRRCLWSYQCTWNEVVQPRKDGAHFQLSGTWWVVQSSWIVPWTWSMQRKWMCCSFDVCVLILCLFLQLPVFGFSTSLTPISTPSPPPLHTPWRENSIFCHSEFTWYGRASRIFRALETEDVCFDVFEMVICRAQGRDPPVIAFWRCPIVAFSPLHG